LAETRPAATNPRLRDAVASLDAEDIALARLQAHLRRTEAIHTGVRPAATAPQRTTVRLPAVLLARLRERAKRDGVTASEVVEQALERFLRSH
jgi:Ribbon-helix-helix protein, copG family